MRICRCRCGAQNAVELGGKVMGCLWRNICLKVKCNLETGDHVGWSSGYVLLTYICRDAYKQIAVLIHYIYLYIYISVYFFNGYDINLSI